MPHGDDVGLAGAAAHRRHRKVDAVRTALERGEIARDAVAGRLMAVELDVYFVAEELARSLHRLEHGAGRGGARCVLEADAVEGDAGIHDLFEAVTVELGAVRTLRVDSRGKPHHRDDDFVVEARVVDALAGPLEVVHVVEGVKVADGTQSMLLEHVGMELDHVGALGVESDDVHAAGKGLQISLGSGLAECVHDVERIFLTIEVAALEAGTAASFKPADAGIIALLHAREEVLGENARTDHGLETVTERCEHVLYCFLGHFRFSF